MYEGGEGSWKLAPMRRKGTKECNVGEQSLIIFLAVARNAVRDGRCMGSLHRLVRRYTAAGVGL